MMRSFNIIDGIVYVDKMVYQEAQMVDNNISKLLGSTNVNMFKKRPTITTGVESVTVDFHDVNGIGINKDPMVFVDEIREKYHKKVRGHIVVDVGDDSLQDICINVY